MAIDEIVSRRLFNVGEYYAMLYAGILPEDASVELIRGEIFYLHYITPYHAAVNGKFMRLCFDRFAEEASTVSIRNPIRLDSMSEPIPDASLLKPRRDFYSPRHPGPDDAYLVVEIADESLRYDREVKIPLYAEAGVLEVWLIDLTAATVESFRQPVGLTYDEHALYRRGELLSPAAFPDVSFPVSDILIR